MTLKAIVLIDGEHYIPVTKSALERLKTESDYSLVGAAFLGSAGKIGGVRNLTKLEIPVVAQEGDMRDESSLFSCVQNAIAKFSPDVVIDLSGEPVLSFQIRMRLANLILSSGISYRGADFLFEPGKLADIAERPAISIVALGKRAGKTSLSICAAKILSERYRPVIITMGRGGPQTPELIEGDKIKITPEFLLSQVDLGRHASGDNYEDALFARIPVVGCSRVGSGLAGAVFYSTVFEGAALANSLDRDLQIYEGSGTTSPGVLTDAQIVVVAAHQPPDLSSSAFHTLRIKKTDLIVLTGCETPPSSPAAIESLEATLREVNPEVRLLRTIFRPQPLGEIRGKRVIYATTAPQSVLPVLTRYIEDSYSCNVIGVLLSLANSELLRSELEALFSSDFAPELLLTELKAASVDVAVRLALSRGLDIAFCHNAIQDAEDSEGVFNDEILRVAEMALKRFKVRRPESSKTRC